MTLSVGPHKPSLGATNTSSEAPKPATDLKIDPQFGPHRILSTLWLEQHKQSLSKDQAALIDHVVAALEGRVAVMRPLAEAEGGRFEFAQPFHGAEQVTFGINHKGVINHLDILGSNTAARVSIGEHQSPQEPSAKRLKTGLDQGQVNIPLPSPGLLHPSLYAHEKADQKRTREVAEHEMRPSEDSSRVRMKLKGRNGGRFPGGVGQVNLKIAEKAQGKYGDAGTPSKQPPQLAMQGDDGIWRGTPADGSLALDKLDGHFIYVTLLNGDIRLGNAVNGQNAHALLSGNAKDVRYAGTVTFSDGHIQRYTNESGTYVPPEALRYQAGFNQGAGFGAVGHPFVPITAHAKAAAEQAFTQLVRSRVERIVKPSE